MQDLEKECEKLDCVALRKIAIRFQEMEQQRKDRQKLDCHAYAKKCQCILKAVGSRERIPGEDEGEGIRCIRPVRICPVEILRNSSTYKASPMPITGPNSIFTCKMPNSSRSKSYGNSKAIIKNFRI